VIGTNKEGYVNLATNALINENSADGPRSERRPSRNAQWHSEELLDLPAECKDRGGALGGSRFRTERIVLVDDNSIMRTTTQQALESLGFDVQAFANGEEAIEAIAQDPRPISLLVTDYEMPGLTRGELERRVRIERPDTPILVASGSDQHWRFAQFDPAIRLTVIQKPYSLKKLARTIRAILNGNPAELQSASSVTRCAS
jgi:CheY-like chemotaxis protein